MNKSTTEIGAIIEAVNTTIVCPEANSKSTSETLSAQEAQNLRAYFSRAAREITEAIKEEFSSNQELEESLA